MLGKRAVLPFQSNILAAGLAVSTTLKRAFTLGNAQLARRFFGRFFFRLFFRLRLRRGLGAAAAEVSLTAVSGRSVM